jgi:hypothetical protein
MFPQILVWTAALALAAVTPGANAHDGPLDPTFGDGGMRNYGFQSVNGSGRNDRAAAVACPGPGGTLVVTGEASDATRLVTMRLLPNGDYDPSFGAGGRVSVPFAMTQEYYMAGLCLPNGKILLARRLSTDASNDTDVQLLRIDAATGQFDASFGQGGASLLDLDSWQSGLGRTESPLALTPLDGGEVLLTGHVGLSNRIVAFAARVREDGSVPAARVYIDAANRPIANTLMTAMLASDGTIWGIVEGAYPGSTRVTPFRVRLDRTTLAWIDTPDAAPNATGNPIYAGRGTRVRGDVLAVPQIQFVEGSNPARYLTGLMIYRAGGKFYLPLPDAGLPGETLTLSGTYAMQSAVVLPGDRVLAAYSVERSGNATPRGMHLAMVQIGPAIGSDRVDTTFGDGGARTAAFRAAGSGCQESLVEQDFSGAALWNGAPVLVGNVNASCSNDGGGLDYLVARIAVDRLFASGLE